MLTIISALKSEIASLLQKVPIAEKRNLAGGSLYISDRIHFLRTGIGRKKAGKVFGLYLKQFRPEKVLNIGLAGKMDPDFKIGEIYSISRIFSEYGDPIEIHSRYEDKSASLLSVDQPVTNSVVRDILYKEFGAELVDMEAYVTANIASRGNIPFSSIKIISDDADKNTAVTFLKNYKNFAGILAEFIWENELSEYLS